NTANNSATANTTVVGVTDLAVSKDGASDVAGGQNLTYTIVVNNLSTVAHGVTLTDDIPDNTTFVSATQTAGPLFTLSKPPVGGTGTFSATIATLAGGASATFRVVVHVDSTAPVGGQIENTATVTSTTMDTDEDDNTA